MIAAHLFPLAFSSLSELKQLLPPPRAAQPARVNGFSCIQVGN